MILGVTGHRPDKLGGYGKQAAVKLVQFASICLEEIKPDRVVTGMALGWDTAIAIACLELGIPYTAAVPFFGQELRWPAASQEMYRKLLTYAAEVVTICEAYSPAAMQDRNEWIVAHCHEMLALYGGSPGGTRNCVRYADKCRIPVMNVWKEWRAYDAG